MIWFLYEKWKDILVFNHGYESYLIQGRKNKVTRKTVFRATGVTPFCLGRCETLNEKYLQNAGLWECEK